MAESIREYVKSGEIEQYKSLLLKEIETTDFFEVNVVYSKELFEHHLKHVKYVYDFDNVTSAISRCVEYGFEDQLKSLVDAINNNKDWLKLSPDADPNVVQSLDRRLLLRKINFKCYLIARNAGFIDREFEKRIVLLQNLWRKKKVVEVSYSGPTPEEYYGGPVTDTNDCRYWGYRHTLYFLKWNRTYRYKILNLLNTAWGGDCRYQAYIDYLEPTGENLPLDY